MKKWDLYFEEALRRYKELLKELNLIEIEGKEWRFVPVEKVPVHAPGKVKIRRADLLTRQSFAKVFAKFCEEGRDWIHLSVVGVSGKFLIIDYNVGRPIRNPKPSVNFGGPPIDPQTKVPLEEKIILS